MRRVLSALLAAILSILCLADGWLWFRGYSIGDIVIYRWIPEPSLRFIQIYTASGGLRIIFGSETYPPAQDARLFSWETGLHHSSYSGQRYPIETWGDGKQWGGLGFYYYHLSDPVPSTPGDIRIRRTYHGITFPHAFLIFLLAVYPFRVALNIRRRRLQRFRSQRGLCLNCGYDLHGLTDVCPECGSRLNPDPQIANPN